MLQSKLKPVSIITIVVASLFIFGGVVHASYEAQIRELNQENQQTREQKSELQTEASSLEDAIASVRSKISSVETQITNNRNKQTNVEQQITAAQQQIEEEKKILGLNIKEMYFADKMTTVEMLATSNNLSEYVDKQTYRESVSEKINSSLQQIEKLKNNLNVQKVALKKLIDDQQSMQSQLVNERTESARLLAMNEDQQSEYDKELKANSKKIAELRAQQARENQRNIIGPTSAQVVGTGSYPYAHVNPFPNSIVDPWGMFMRQCVSYTAWKVASTGRHMPYWGGRGNANRWPGNAQAAGIPVNTTPAVGTVAVSMAGFYGHTMYVEQVHGDGTITVSDYNLRWDGQYSMYRRTTAGLQFIHF